MARKIKTPTVATDIEEPIASTEIVVDAPKNAPTTADLATSRSGSIAKDMLSDLVSSFYQIQKLRIQLGNKLSAHFYRKLGLEAAEKLIEQQQGDKKASVDMIDVLRVQFRRVADGLSDFKIVNEKKFASLTQDTRGIFDEYIEYSWMSEYRDMLGSENRVLKDIEICLDKFPIWTDWLCKIKGVGPTTGGVIVSLIDIRKAETPASLWAFAGMDVVPINNKGEVDGRGRGRFREHLVKAQYKDREGVDKVRDSITFNPMLKTKLLGVLADSFIKHRAPKYREEYDNYKARITERENANVANAKARGDEDFKRKTPAHLNRMAIRYMMKRFLVDLYKEWRGIEGLEIVPEYGERKLGLEHHTGRGRWGEQMRAGMVLREENNSEDQTPATF